MCMDEEPSRSQEQSFYVTDNIDLNESSSQPMTGYTPSPIKIKNRKSNRKKRRRHDNHYNNDQEAKKIKQEAISC